MYLFGIPIINLNLHPLFFITIAYMLGVAWYVSAWYYILPFLLFFIIAAWVFSTIYARSIITLAMVFSTLLGAYRIASIIDAHTKCFDQLPHERHAIIATIIDIATHDHMIYKQKITLHIHRIKNEVHTCRVWQPADFIVSVYTRKTPGIRTQDEIFMPEITIKPIENQSFVWYLIKEGVMATLFMDRFSHELLNRPENSLNRAISELREHTVQSLKKKMSRRTFQLFSSIFLGYKPVPKQELEASKNHFATWGLMHYLARSGLHMVIFIFVWQVLLGLLPLPFVFKQISLILLTIIYCLLSWTSISFIRAVLSFLLLKLCTLLFLRTNFLHILTIVCFTVVLHNPLQLFFLDFQLSFGLTFALALFSQLQTALAHNY